MAVEYRLVCVLSDDDHESPDAVVAFDERSQHILLLDPLYGEALLLKEVGDLL